MVRTLCVCNRKGGVGKTTTAVNLAAGLARSGARTLLVDLDPQCNATRGLGETPTTEHPLATGKPLRDGIRATNSRNLEILPGSRSYASVEALAAGKPDLIDSLQRQIAGGTVAYDMVLVDCPPSMGNLTLAALSASNEVLMPVQCEYYALEGLAEMIQLIGQVMKQRPGKLEFAGILLTLFDADLELSHEVETEVRDFFGEIVFQTVIPRDVTVAEAPSHGKSALEYAPRGRGARAYIELCMEVLGYDEPTATTTGPGT